MTVRDEANALLIEGGRPVLAMQRSAKANEPNLRVYADTVLTALRCSMNVQLTDGRAMLPKYVAGYVSKCKDPAIAKETLLSAMKSHEIAYRYIRDPTSAEPEIVMSLSDCKMSHTCSDFKKLLVPTTKNVE